MAFRVAGANQNDGLATAIQLVIDPSVQVGDVITFGVFWVGAHTGFAPSSSNGGSFEDLTGFVPSSSVAKAQAWKRIAVSGDAGSTITISITSDPLTSGRVSAVYIASSGLDAAGTAVVQTTVGTSSGTTLDLPSATPAALTNGGDVIYIGGGQSDIGGEIPVFNAGASSATLRAQETTGHGSAKNACGVVLDKAFVGETEVPATSISSDLQVDGRIGFTILHPATSAPRPVATLSTPTPVVAAGTTGLQLNTIVDDGGGTGGPYTFQHRRISGPGSDPTYSDATAQNPTITSELDAGTHVFGVIATDSGAVPSIEDTLNVVASGAGVIVRPISDNIVTNWTPEPGSAPTIASTVGDGNDGTYAIWTGALGPVDPLDVGLPEWVITPGLGGQMGLRIRAIGAAGQATLQLREGASTVISASAPQAWDDPGTIVQFDIIVTPAEAASIVNPANLRLVLTDVTLSTSGV